MPAPNQQKLADFHKGQAEYRHGHNLALLRGLEQTATIKEEIEDIETRIEFEAAADTESETMYYRQMEDHMVDDVPELFRGGLHSLQERTKELRGLCRNMAGWAQAIARNPGKCFMGQWLHGAVGCGKTSLCWGGIIALRKFGVLNAELFSVTDLLARIQATYRGESAESEAGIIQRCTASRVLILDDFGAHTDSVWTAELLYRVLNPRVEARLPTSITSNLTMDEFFKSRKEGRDQWGRIMSRLTEIMTPVHIEGGSIREAQAGGWGGKE